MKIIENIKSAVKRLAAKISGEPKKPNFANIFIIKNGEKLYTIDSSDEKNLSDNLIKIINYFHKYNDYKIIFNYVDREIYILFTVKKGNEIECTD